MSINYRLASPSGRPIHINIPNTLETVASPLGPSFRCPHCRQIGTFMGIGTNDARISIVERPGGAGSRIVEQPNAGIRVCPNSKCRGFVFVIYHGDAVVSFPSEVLDFDPTDIPPRIVGSLEEAISCHAARCYRASALMVRQALEELCEERGATGGNLKERLEQTPINRYHIRRP
jgi:hypothetical protein